MIVPDEWNDWKVSHRARWWWTPGNWPNCSPLEAPVWIFYADKTPGEDYWFDPASCNYFGFELDGADDWKISASLIDPDDEEPARIDITEIPPGFIEKMRESEAVPSMELAEAIDRARLRNYEVREAHEDLIEDADVAPQLAEAAAQPRGYVRADEEVRTTSSTGGQKGVKPQRYSLLPPEAMNAIAMHFGKGAEKYDDHQWRKGYEWSKSFDAMQRHAWAFWSGEDNDAETGTPHMAAVGFHAMVLLTFMKTHPGHDDRPKK